jgi:hypothetical protein
VNFENDPNVDYFFARPPMTTRKVNGYNTYSIFNQATIDQFYVQWTNLDAAGVEANISGILLGANATFTTVPTETLSAGAKKRKRELEKGCTFNPYEEEARSHAPVCCFNSFEITKEENEYFKKHGRKF